MPSMGLLPYNLPQGNLILLSDYKIRSTPLTIPETSIYCSHLSALWVPQLLLLSGFETLQLSDLFCLKPHWPEVSVLLWVWSGRRGRSWPALLPILTQVFGQWYWWSHRCLWKPYCSVDSKCANTGVSHLLLGNLISPLYSQVGSLSFTVELHIYPVWLHPPRVTIPNYPASCGALTSGTPTILSSLSLRHAKSSSLSVLPLFLEDLREEDAWASSLPRHLWLTGRACSMGRERATCP